MGTRFSKGLIMEEYDELESKIKILSETIWESRINASLIKDWLDNFNAKNRSTREKEVLHALHLLSHFMYFGDMQIREMLKAVYRDLICYPIIYRIRKENNDTTNEDMIRDKLNEQIRKTRFLGVGNPSESGCHLLYYFRQENRLDKDLFINSIEIFDDYTTSEVRFADPNVQRYIFIDDFCSSGSQAIGYTKKLVENIKAQSIKAGVDISIEYFVLFGCRKGLSEVLDQVGFNRVDTIFELDRSYECFSEKAYCFVKTPDYIDRDFSEKMAFNYGSQLISNYPFGFNKYDPNEDPPEDKYSGCQYLLGFHHNTPDNTLPIIWNLGTDSYTWKPIFRRYYKFKCM